ncbi:MAG TPA: hypothetical protein VFA77_14455, partial [Candidatus Eisenbacteria bacterium]|nr:hypothetical protein [Candidatus Eisenbacteria bacterium]
TRIPGTWIGGTRTLVGFTENMAVSLQVRVWNSVGFNGEFFPTWEMAFTAYNGLNTGKSSVFSYYIPSPGSPPSAFLMSGFQGFSLVDCPEPSPYLLISLGLCLSFLFKRCVARE